MSSMSKTAVYNQTAKIIRAKVDEANLELNAGRVAGDEFEISTSTAKIVALNEVADLFAGEYQADNVKFNHARFMTACGFDTPERKGRTV